MDINEMKKYIEEIGKNDELKTAILDLQRKAETAGWPREEYASKLAELVSSAGISMSAEVAAIMVQSAGNVMLSDEELENVAGGSACGIISHDCSKWKDCGGGTGRWCYPHC